MINNDNVKIWMDCWNASIPEPDLITEKVQVKRWDQRSIEFGKNVGEERKQKKTADFFDVLNRAGFSPEGATVLDIGCGPGSLSIPLAQAGATVTAYDISGGMLDRLQEDAIQQGLEIRTVSGSWWTADIDNLGFRNAFDLVIASMTPAIWDVQTFDLMRACSKNFCYYSNFIRKDSGKVPGEIYVTILGKLPSDNLFASGFLYPFMYVYLQGFRPVVQINHKPDERELEWSNAAEKAIDYLQMSLELTDDQKGRIRDYYRDASPDGIYSSHSDLYSGMMVWSE